MTDPSDYARALAYLESHHTMSIATCGAREPWNAAVFYVNRGFDLFFVSSAKTLHGRQIAKNGAVAVTIQEDYSHWRDIKGVQIAGVASIFVPTEHQAIMQRYAAKFPFLKAEDEETARIAKALQRSDWFQIVPRKVLFIDNDRGFGYRAEIALPAADQAP